MSGYLLFLSLGSVPLILCLCLFSSQVSSVAGSHRYLPLATR